MFRACALLSKIPGAAADVAPGLTLMTTRSLNYFGALNGPAVKLTEIQDEWYNRQRNSIMLNERKPWTQLDTYIAPNAVLSGEVDVYNKVAIFFGAVVRADLNKIRIGYQTVIMDRAVIHASRAVPTGLNAACLIGSYVTVEPGAILRSCRVEHKCIIGARSVLCEGSMMESESILAPASVLPPARLVPSGELWGGNPARFIRKLTENERTRVIEESAIHHYNMAYAWKKEEMPYATAWRDVEAYRAKLIKGKEYQWINFREQKYLMRLQHEAEEMERVTHS